MWKDWFYFSGRERNGIFVLIIIMLLLLAANVFLPRHFHPRSADMSNYAQLIDSLLLQQNYKQSQWISARKQNELYADSLDYFNPNLVDSAWMYNHGFGTTCIYQLMAYRDKGGNFKVKDDFSKLYAVSEQEYAVLEPFILLPDSIVKQTYQPKKTKRVSIATKFPASPKSEPKELIMVELNAADTAILQKIYGIGPAYAKRIVGYRNILGGYVRKSQLLEVYGLELETYDLIRPHVWIDSSLVRKIRINKTSVRQLKAHPYLNFYQSKAIYEWTRHDSIRAMEELYNIQDLDTNGIWKLNGYLDFNVSGSASGSIRE